MRKFTSKFHSMRRNPDFAVLLLAWLGVAACALETIWVAGNVWFAGPEKFPLGASFVILPAWICDRLSALITDSEAAHRATAYTLYLWLYPLMSLAFAVAFWVRVTTRRKMSAWASTTLLGGQVLFAVTYSVVLVYFVALELALVLPLRRAAAWMGFQVGLMLAAIYVVSGNLPQIAVHTAQPIITVLQFWAGEFFSTSWIAAFFLVGHIAASERRNRIRLEGTHAELKAARQLLDDVVRSAERIRISQSVQKAAGAYIATLLSQLETAMHCAGNLVAESVQKSRQTAQRLLSEIRVLVGVERQEQMIDLQGPLETYCAGWSTAEIELSFDRTIVSACPSQAGSLFQAVREVVGSLHRSRERVRLRMNFSGRGRDLSVNISGSGHLQNKDGRGDLDALTGRLNALGWKVKNESRGDSDFHIALFSWKEAPFSGVDDSGMEADEPGVMTSSSRGANIVGVIGLYASVVVWISGMANIWVYGSQIFALDFTSLAIFVLTTGAALLQVYPGTWAPHQLYYLGYSAHIVVFAWATYMLVFRPGRRSADATALLILVQTAVAVLGNHALLYVVAAELPLLLPPRRALRWLGLLLVLVMVAMVPFWLALDASSIGWVVNLLLRQTWICLPYLAGYLAVRERSTRKSLEIANAELKATDLVLRSATRNSERVRIARDLHDEIGHHLTALNLHLELASRNEGGQQLADCLQMAYGIAQQLQDDVNTVAGKPDDIVTDLEQALRALSNRIPSPAIHLAIGADLKIESAEAANTLFRSVQEAVSNAVRHSGAHAMKISLCERDGGIELFIEDDGRGMGDGRPGNGLRGMRERIELLAGRMDILDADGKGLALRVWLPPSRNVATSENVELQPVL